MRNVFNKKSAADYLHIMKFEYLNFVFHASFAVVDAYAIWDHYENYKVAELLIKHNSLGKAVASDRFVAGAYCLIVAHIILCGIIMYQISSPKEEEEEAKFPPRGFGIT